MSSPAGSGPLDEPRITPRQAMNLLLHAETADLMARADRIRRRLHGKAAYFTHSLNLNPTNVCENRCELCAFWRKAGAADAYVMSLGQARRKMARAASWRLTDLHIVGGLHDRLGLAYYESLIRAAGQCLDGVLVQGLTAVEIDYLARREGLSLAAVLRRLKLAGLGAIPGGGAEIFAPAVRRRICPRKISARRWLAIHRQAHKIGLPTNATMLFGHLEKPRDIVDHLDRLRRLQDATGGFQAFVLLPFHPAGAHLHVARGPSGQTIVRVAALARIFLDNVSHLRVLANYLDRKLLGVLTAAGADDVGPTSLHERIARAAGAPEDRAIESIEEMKGFLRGLGLEPRLVNSVYKKCDAKGQSSISKRQRGDGPPSPSFGDRGLSSALRRAEAGRRLSAEDAVALHDHADLAELGRLAHKRRMQMVPQKRVTFVVDRNLSITNVCQSGCKFCAFHVRPGQAGGFALSIEQIVEKTAQAVKQGATQVMLQGGLNPRLDLGFYERMLRAIKRRVDVCLHSLSPAEVLYIARRAALPVVEALHRLRQAGLDSLPGGGAEILVEQVRRRVSPHKITARQWFAVMEAAQRLGMRTTATMVYGLGETPAQRVQHLLGVRDLQDRTGGFTAFIPWSFQPNRTRLALPPQTGLDYLRVLALARLVLDNLPHIQAGWLTEGPDVAQLALSFGADDFGGVLMEEKVLRATGVTQAVTVEQVIWLIRQAGMTPAQRTTQYEILRTF